MKNILKAVQASNMYENDDSYLKKEYLLKYIDLFYQISTGLPGHKGTFGLGYPFYALGPGLKGELPIIDEQIRYNIELLFDFMNNCKEKVWLCEECLREFGDEMPDLKKICYKCPKVDMTIKPRKVINRLPDMDFCIVIEDGYEEITKSKILEQFDKYGLGTSDIDPIKTINDVFEISSDLAKGVMPKKYVPLDVHLFSYSNLYRLMENVVPKLESDLRLGKTPYLPALPYSLRKVWQYDDQAINFIFDFIYSFTEHEFESELLKKLKETRKELVQKYSNKELEDVILQSGPSSLARRYESKSLKKCFNERINEWRKL